MRLLAASARAIDGDGTAAPRGDAGAPVSCGRACTIERQTLDTAVQAYELLNGAPPASQQDLLDAQMIRELSVRYEISADGVVMPAAGSPCV